MFRGVCRFLTLGLSQHCGGNFCAQSFFVLPFGKKEMFSIIARYFIPFYLSIKSYNRIKITIQKNVLHKSVFGSRLQFQTYCCYIFKTASKSSFSIFYLKLFIYANYLVLLYLHLWRSIIYIWVHYPYVFTLLKRRDQRVKQEKEKILFRHEWSVVCTSI